VTLGATEGERVAVLTGVSDADTVVVDGADRLKEGMEVDPQFPTQTPGAAGKTPGGHAWSRDGKPGADGKAWGGKPAADGTPGADGEHRHRKPPSDGN